MALCKNKIEIAAFGMMLIIFIIVVNIIFHLRNNFPKYRGKKSINCGELGFKNHL